MHKYVELATLIPDDKLTICTILATLSIVIAQNGTLTLKLAQLLHREPAKLATLIPDLY